MGRRALAGFAAALAVATAVSAQGTAVAFGAMRQDTDAPVEVEAEELNVDQESGTAEFSGGVTIGQGEMRMQAARVLVVYDEDGQRIARLEATGGVTLASGADAAESQRADYDVDKGTIVMTGDVLLTQGPSALTAERLTVDLEAGTARMTGRVRTVLQPDGN